MRPEGEREGATAVPRRGAGGMGGAERGRAGRGGIYPGGGGPGRGANPHWDDKTPPVFPLLPPTEDERGRRELGLTKNNSEITITKANPGARALAAPEPTVNKQSRQTVCQINSCLHRV